MSSSEHSLARLHTYTHFNKHLPMRLVLLPTRVILVIYIPQHIISHKQN